MRYYFLLLVSLSLFSCQKDTPYHQPFPSYEITLVYMVADNDLAPYALKDLNEIERGFVPNGKDKLLVYIDSNTSTALPSHPVLLEIVPDTTEIQIIYQLAKLCFSTYTEFLCLYTTTIVDNKYSKSCYSQANIHSIHCNNPELYLQISACVFQPCIMLAKQAL